MHQGNESLHFKTHTFVSEHPVTVSVKELKHFVVQPMQQTKRTRIVSHCCPGRSTPFLFIFGRVVCPPGGAYIIVN